MNENVETCLNSADLRLRININKLTRDLPHKNGPSA